MQIPLLIYYILTDNISTILNIELDHPYCAHEDVHHPRSKVLPIVHIPLQGISFNSRLMSCPN